MGYTATWAGIVTAPVGVLAILLSPWVGKNVSRIDPRKLATIAFLGFALVFWMRSEFNVQAPVMTILIPTLLQGVAVAFFFVPLQAIIFSGLTPDQLPAASGLSNFARITAGAVGTSLFTTLWENRASLHHAQLAESINRGNDAATQAMTQLGAAGQTPEQVTAIINRLLDQQAYTMAVTDVFYLSAVLFILLIALLWFAHPKSAAGAAADAGGAH
jgi:DHA2 family multidrug resistance protein